MKSLPKIFNLTRSPIKNRVQKLYECPRISSCKVICQKSSNAAAHSYRSASRPETFDSTKLVTRKTFNDSVKFSLLSLLTFNLEGDHMCYAKGLPFEAKVPIRFYDGTYQCEFSIEGGRKLYGQIDTGSPFIIMTPDRYLGEGTTSSLPDSYVYYAGEEGEVQWFQGRVEFGPATVEDNLSTPPVTFGVFKFYVIKGGDTDVIIGLVKNKTERIQETFLEQTNIRTVMIDFINNELLLSSRVLITKKQEFIPLVDLRSKCDAPIQHYICEVENLIVNNQLVRSEKTMYAMIDTGASGVYISDDVFYGIQRQAKGFKSMEIDIKTSRGGIKSVRASRPDPNFLVLPGSFPWLPSDAMLIVIGVVFLQNCKLTLDVDKPSMILDVPAS